MTNKKLGMRLGRHWKKINGKQDNALIIALVGPLGSGKTIFAQGVAAGLGIRQRINSPTFIIIKRYRIGVRRQRTYLYHIDAYRLLQPEDLEALGFRALGANPQNIVLVEWADKIYNRIPSGAVYIMFNTIKKIQGK